MREICKYGSPGGGPGNGAAYPTGWGLGHWVAGIGNRNGGWHMGMAPANADCHQF